MALLYVFQFFSLISDGLGGVIQNKLCDPSIVQQQETCQKPNSNQPQWVSVKKTKSMVFSALSLFIGGLEISMICSFWLKSLVDGLTASLVWVFGCYIVDGPQGTLVYRIEVQTQIKVQVGEFSKINKCAVRNKYAGKTSCKKSLNVQDLLLQ